MQLEAMEFKWHPGATKPGFHQLNTGPIISYGSATAAQLSAAGDSAGTNTVCILAWRGLSGTARLELTKNIEWRPGPNQGVVAAVPMTVRSETSYLDAVRELDIKQPSWWHDAATKAMTGLGSMLYTAAKSAATDLVFGGTGRQLLPAARIGMRMLT